MSKSKRPGRRKHVPQRTCVACRTTRPKRDLVRIVRTSEGEVVVDETGKRDGRGAYLCRQRTCWDRALKKRQLERALKAPITADVGARLREHAQTYPIELPQALATGSGEIEGSKQNG